MDHSVYAISLQLLFPLKRKLQRIVTLFKNDSSKSLQQSLALSKADEVHTCEIYSD